MAIPTVGTVVDAQQYALRRITERHKDAIEFIYPKTCINRIFHDYARNALVEEFLATDADICWFLDSDISPPDHVLDAVIKNYDEWNVAGAPYPVFMSQPGEDQKQVVFTVYRGADGIGLCPSKIPYSGIDYVDGVATGCIFVKRHVFEAIPKPWFSFKYDETDRKLVGGEDIDFCHKVSKLGYKFLVDFSAVCSHFKTINLLEANNYAITYTNKAVQAYSDMTKDQVLRLAARIRELEAKLKEKAESEKPKSRLILPNHFK